MQALFIFLFFCIWTELLMFCNGGCYGPMTPFSSTRCSQGEYYSSTLGKCAKCPSGTYTSTGYYYDGCTSITDCEPTQGYYGNAGEPASICPENHYCVGGIYPPTPCADNAWSVPGSSSTIDCAPVAGFYDNSRFGVSYANRPIPCPIGSYCPKSSVNPSSCPENSFTRALRSTSINNCTANSGYYKNSNGTIVVCPGGYICIESSTAVGTACSVGKFSVQGQSVCTECTIGTYETGIASSVCSLCTIGKYATITGKSDNVCPDCEVGKYSSSHGQSQCALCSQGTYGTTSGPRLAIHCIACEQGKYSTVSGNDVGCSLCDKGKYNDIVGKTECANCSAGTYNVLTGQTTCEACEIAKFSNQSGNQVGCDFCEIGTYNNLRGQSMCTNCIAGTYMSLTGALACSACELGKFSNQTKRTSCIQCEKGKYSPGQGVTVCIQCPLEQTNVVSPIKSIYFYNGMLNPLDLMQQNNLCSFRSKCPENYYMDKNLYAEGSNIKIDCVACSALKECPPGKYFQCDSANSNAVCQECSPPYISGNPYKFIYVGGQFGPVNGCQWICLKNYYKTTNVVPTCEDCLLDATSLNCPSGYYTYAACMLGDGKERATCMPCTFPANAKNLVTGGSGRVINDDKSCDYECINSSFAKIQNTYTCQRFSCVAGTNPKITNSEIICEPCLPGFYQPSTIVDLTQKNCTQCEGDTYTEDQSSVMCLKIPNNSIVLKNKNGFTCNAGFYKQTFTDGLPPTCTKCPLANVSNTASFVYVMSADPGIVSCNFIEFFCNSGYYRVFYSSFNMSCRACPSSIVPSQLSNALQTSSMIKDSLIQTCNGNVPDFSVCSEDDEINLACYPNLRCQNWYYVKNTLTSTQKSYTKSCFPCSNVTCPNGQFLQGCSYPSEKNWCGNCSQMLKSNQVFPTPGFCLPTCDSGYYWDNSGACIACPSGKYKNKKSDSVSDCLFCNNGYFADTEALTECKSCPRGTYSQDSNISRKVLCDNCPSGFFSSVLNSTKCDACSNGMFQNLGGQSECKACAGIYPFSNAGSTSCFLPIGTTCPTGFFKSSLMFLTYFQYYTINTYINSSTLITNENEKLCQPCYEGLYCPGNNSALVCSSQSRNKTYSPMFSNTFENCSLFKKLGLECSDPSYSFQPQKCPDNTTTWGKTNSKTKFACHPKLGYFGLPGVPAQPCPLDHFCMNYYETISSNSGNNIAPIPCPLSSPWAPLMSHQLSNCSTIMYTPCRAGYFMSIHLNNGSKKEICEPCLNGSYCPGINDEIILCPTYLEAYSDSPPFSTSIQNCSQKKGVPQAGSACPSNTQIPNNGQSTQFNNILQCRANPGYIFIPNLMSQAVPCPVGYYCSNQSAFPILCPQAPTVCSQGSGYFRNPAICTTSNKFAPDPTCLPCPSTTKLPNSFYSMPGQNCDFCCNIGYFKDTDPVSGLMLCRNFPDTTSCPPGQYMPAFPKLACVTTTVFCQNCVYGIADFSSDYNKLYYEGLYEPLNISKRNEFISMSLSDDMRWGNKSCYWQCKNGSYYDINLKVCTACPRGKYRNNLWGVFNETSCLDCPLKTYASNVGSTQCYTCGKWSLPHEDEVCLSCAKYSSLNPSKCISCSQYTISKDPGRQTCNCVNGSFSNAYSFTFIAEITGKTILNASCSGCPEGSVIVQDGSTKICSSCPSGKLCSVNLDLTRPCNGGYFRPTNKSVCTPCSPGTFIYYETTSLYNTATVCTLCPTGTYSSKLGSSTCTQCSADSFSTGRQSTQCYSCPYQTNSTKSNGTQCTCPRHTYFETDLFGKMGNCKPCSFQSCDSNATLTACEVGSVSDTSKCTCNKGFEGSGLSCTKCSDPNVCVCSIGNYQKYV